MMAIDGRPIDFRDMRFRNINVSRIGDSRFDADISGDQLVRRSSSIPYHLEMQMGLSCSFPASMDFGVSGDTTDAILDRFDTVLESGADHTMILGSTNDRLTASISAADSLWNLNEMYLRAIDRGITVSMFAEMPRGDANFPANRLSGSNLRDHFNVRDGILQWAGRPGLHIADAWPYMVNPLSADGDAIIGDLYDGLHPGSRAAHKAAKAAAPGLIQMLQLPQRSMLPVSNAMAWAADEPWGWLTPNPMLAGTDGDVSKGDLASSWTFASIPAGVNVACSKITVNGEVRQRLVLSGTAAAPGTLELRSNVVSPLTKISYGDKVESVGSFYVSAGASGINQVYLCSRLAYASGSPSAEVSVSGQQLGFVDVFPDFAYGGPTRTPPLPCRNGSLLSPNVARMFWGIGCLAGPVSLTVDFGPSGLRKINPLYP